jgi:hypothetical protein
MQVRQSLFGTLSLLVAIAFSQPVLAQNLVVNGDFSAGNTGFDSQYTFGSTFGFVQAAASYTITPNPNTAIGWASYTDHTTGDGLMMLVNGAITPDLFFWSQTVSVLPNTTYQFSGWGANPTGPPLPQIDFRVNGTSIGILGIPATQGEWGSFVGTWFSGSNTTATLRLFDLDLGSGNNDFSMDDMSFSRTSRLQRSRRECHFGLLVCWF